MSWYEGVWLHELAHSSLHFPSQLCIQLRCTCMGIDNNAVYT